MRAQLFQTAKTHLKHRYQNADNLLFSNCLGIAVVYTRNNFTGSEVVPVVGGLTKYCSK